MKLKWKWGGHKARLQPERWAHAAINMGPIYREERTRTAKTQMGRYVYNWSRKTMVKTCKRQKKVERTRKIILIRTKVKLDYKSSKCVESMQWNGSPSKFY
ncbi:hypothetical protein C0J52_22937 [Blattella germanica]|nr:hypothetical protein C0J52_22937 [Blattella germanica]